MRKSGSVTAPIVRTLKRKFKVIHQFHPHFRKEFELVSYRNSWKKKCVEYEDENGELSVIPLNWTDAEGLDPFIEISKGRSFFHIKALLRLCELAADLKTKTVKINKKC